MLIRSQDKTVIANIDNAFNIAIRDINGATAIHIGTQGSCCNMAEYSTKAKMASGSWDYNRRIRWS